MEKIDNNLTKEALRKEFSRLINSNNINDEIDAYKLTTDAAFSIISKHQNVPIESYFGIDAGHLFQMTILKNLSILKLQESLNYSNGLNNFSLNIYDPYAMFNIIRAQFEAYCLFNNIYVLSRDFNELKLKYDLWVLSGLKNRQKFNATKPEFIEKKEKERIQITELEYSILHNPKFLALTPKSQKILKQGMENKMFQFFITETGAFYVGWEKMFKNSGINQLFFEEQYHHLSLNTHPSNFSVFQFSSMYSENRDKSTCKLALKISKFITSFLIRDYCIYFPEARSAFNDLPLIHQLLVNIDNKIFRSPEFTLNNVTDILN